MTTQRHLRKVRLQDRTPHRGPQAVSRAAHDDYWYQPRLPESGGVPVTEETSMTYATVWACVNKLAKTIATLPIHVKEHTSENATRNATEQPLDSLLRVKPNAEQTAVQFREAAMANILLWGNTFIYVRETLTGLTQDLWLLLSRYMTVDRNQQGDLVYDYREPGKPARTFLAREILHIAGLSLDGTMGLSVIDFHRQTIGVGLGSTTHVNSFFNNGAQPGIVIERPMESGPLSPEAEQRVLSSFDNRHAGSMNAWRSALLQESMTLNTVSMPLKDMEFIALRRFQKGDIAGIFDVPLTKIHENERDTFANVEHKNIDWKTDSILPWAVKIENAVDAKFYEGTDFFLKHNLEGLARGDTTARYESYALGRQWGWFSVNDIRELEDMNPIEDGDTYIVPMNMIPADQVGQVPEPAPAPSANASDIHGPFRRLALEAAQRCVTKEVKAVGNAWKKHAKSGTVDDFLVWADKFYEGHSEFMAATVGPVVAEWKSVSGNTEFTVGEQMHACYMNGAHKTLLEIVVSTPASVPQFLKDLNETFAASLVADLESKIRQGVKP